MSSLQDMGRSSVWKKPGPTPPLLLSVCLFSTPFLGPVTRDAIGGGGVDETQGERRRLSFRAKSKKHDGWHSRIACPLFPPRHGLSDGRDSVRSQCIRLFLTSANQSGSCEMLVPASVHLYHSPPGTRQHQSYIGVYWHTSFPPCARWPPREYGLTTFAQWPLSQNLGQR